MSVEEAAAVRLLIRPYVARGRIERGRSNLVYMGMERETKRNKAAIDAPRINYMRGW